MNIRIFFLCVITILTKAAFAQSTNFSGALTSLHYPDERGTSPSNDLTGELNVTGAWTLENIALNFDINGYISDERQQRFIDPSIFLSGTSSSNNVKWAVGLLREEWGQPDKTRLNMLVGPNITFGINGDLESVAQPGAMISVPVGKAQLDTFFLTDLRTSPLPNMFDRESFGLPASRVVTTSNMGHGALATRLSGATVSVDWGVHAFYGLTRIPTFAALTNASVAAYYDEITQLGYDVETAPGDWRFWSEGFWRTGSRNSIGSFVNFGHVALGAEYQFFGAMNGDYDVILSGEYRYDSRGMLADLPFENSAAIGGKLIQNAVNGWEAEYRYAYDIESGGYGHKLGFSKKLSETPFLEFNLMLSQSQSGKTKTVLDVLEDDTSISSSIKWKF